MPGFSPFRGVRYDAARVDLDRVTAPPYDVVDDDERAALEASDPHNAVRLILPGDRERADDRYDAAAADLRAWVASGVLRRDAAPHFYGYRMRFRGPDGRDRTTVGVLGALHLPDGEGDVLPHERTLPKARSDRLALLRATRANLDPIWGLSLAEGLSDHIPLDEPLAACTDPEGVGHELFAIGGSEATAAIADAVRSAPMVLADGHHRFETATNYRRERATGGAADPGADAIMALVVELRDEQLDIRPIHRLVDLPDPGALDSALDGFTVSDGGPNDDGACAELVRRMDETGGIGVVRPDRLALAVPGADALARVTATEPEPVAATDAARVEHLVVPALASASVTYRHDARTCARLVATGTHDLALLCRPASVAITRAAAAAGARMAPKTTFFHPKPRTGLVLRTLDEG